MASKLELDIKDLFKEELTALRDEQAAFIAKQEEGLKQIQEISGKVVQNETEVNQLKEAFGRFQQEMETSTKEKQTQVAEDVKNMEARLGEFQKKVSEDCTKFDTILNEISPKFEASLRQEKNREVRTEEFDRMLRDLTRQCEELTEKVKASEARVTKMDGITSTVQSAQEALEDSITRKYNSMWEDVLNAIQEVKGNQVQMMREDLDNQKEACKSETRSLVNYALNFMASAHGERRQMALSKSLMLAWKEQTWISARRRMGVSYLHKILQRRHRVVFDTWHRRHSTSELCDRLKSQYEDKLNDVYKDMREGDKGLSVRCNGIDEEVRKLANEMGTKQSLKQSMDDLRRQLSEEMKVIKILEGRVSNHDADFSRHEEWHRSYEEAQKKFRIDWARFEKELADLIEQCKQYAKNEEVNGMIRDILLLWNSVKQMDAAKADKKDVDSFALETLDRDKLATRRLEDIEQDIALKSKHETLRLQEKWTEFDNRLDESGRQFRHWEQMWEQLSGYVEDLVVKIGDLQGNKPAATLKTPGRVGSNVAKSRLIPTIPGDGRSESATTLRAPQVAEADTKLLWLNSAKGIVDATIDQAVNPAGGGAAAVRSRSRPRSASGARPVSGGLASRPGMPNRSPSSTPIAGHRMV